MARRMRGDHELGGREPGQRVGDRQQRVGIADLSAGADAAIAQRVNRDPDATSVDELLARLASSSTTAGHEQVRFAITRIREATVSVWCVPVLSMTP
jgi:hypothetical protein